MTCQNCGAEGSRPYRYSIGKRTKDWCDACAQAARSMGAAVTAVERRYVDLPVIVERRHARIPRWIGRARDLTGWLAA